MCSNHVFFICNTFNFLQPSARVENLAALMLSAGDLDKKWHLRPARQIHLMVYFDWKE